MKLIFTLSLVSLAKANMNNILDQLSEMTKVNNITLASSIAGYFNDLRAFGDPIRTLMEPIYDYGCWCVFAENWHEAGGAPRDSIDERCKQLVNGYRCAKMDARAAGGDCDAGNVPYSKE